MAVLRAFKTKEQPERVVPTNIHVLVLLHIILCIEQSKWACSEKIDLQDFSVLTLPSSTPDAQREVCWDIDKRGHSGETLLHVCFMSPHNKDVNFEIAKQLIKAWPKLINDIMLGTENYGKQLQTSQAKWNQWILLLSLWPPTPSLLLNKLLGFFSHCS